MKNEQPNEKVKPPPIPLTVMAGFLGADKTTLINHRGEGLQVIEGGLSGQGNTTAGDGIAGRVEEWGVMDTRTDCRTILKSKGDEKVSVMYLKPCSVLGQTRCFVILLIAALLLTVFAPAVWAEDKPNEQSDWEFEIAPYLWGVALSGDITVKGQTSDLDVSFSDIFDELNIAAMVELDGRKGRWGFLVDTIYANLGSGTTVDGIGVDPDMNLLLLTLGGFYRLGTWPLSAAPDKATPAVTVDVLAGARYTYLDLKLDFDPEFIPDPEGSKAWVDPLVGARALFDLSERWTLSLEGNVGGFGVGSNFTWNAFGAFGYRFSLFSKERNARAVAGYRAIYMDYDTGSGADKFEWDITLHGPILGLVIRF